MSLFTGLLFREATLVKRRRKVDDDGDVVTDDRGNDVYEETTTDWKCYHQSADGEEHTNHRQRVEENRWVVFPSDFDGEATDAVILDGREFQITSPVQEQQGPNFSYVHCDVSRVTG